MPDSKVGQIKFVKFWLNNFSHDHAALSLEASGAKIRLQVESLRRQGPVPFKKSGLSRLLGCSPSRVDSIITELVEAGLIELRDDAIHDHDAERGIAEFRAAQARNRRNAVKRYAALAGGRVQDDES